jgi:hypothetical protein
MPGGELGQDFGKWRVCLVQFLSAKERTEQRAGFAGLDTRSEPEHDTVQIVLLADDPVVAQELGNGRGGNAMRCTGAGHLVETRRE